MTNSVFPVPVSWVRSRLGVPLAPGEGLGEDFGVLGDLAFSAILRTSFVKWMLHSDRMELTCLAAGLVGAARDMADMFRVVSLAGGSPVFTCKCSQNASWESCVLKIAGKHGLTLGRSILPTNRYVDENVGSLHTYVGSCLTEYKGSCVSDDAHVRASDVTRWRRSGYVTPVAKGRWEKLVQGMRAFVGPMLLSVRSHAPRMAIRAHHGGERIFRLAPTTCLHLLEAALCIAPGYCRNIVDNTAFRLHVTSLYRSLSDERQRFVLWACGNSADPAAQAKLFDALVALTLDLYPHKVDPNDSFVLATRAVSRDLRAFLYCNAQGQRGASDLAASWRFWDKDNGFTDMVLPPWSLPGVVIPPVVTTRFGVVGNGIYI